MRCSRTCEGSQSFVRANSVMYCSNVENFGVANGNPKISQRTPAHLTKGEG